MMNTPLERLLDNITEVPDRIDQLGDDAINRFPPPPVTIEDWDEYQAFLARFFCHLECQVLGIGQRRLDPRMDLSRAWPLLRKTFGPGAPQAGFEITRTGIDGGTLHIMRTMANVFAKEYADNLISMAVEIYCSQRSVTELLADADEYVATFQHILPGEIAEGSAARIHANFRKVLKQHPFVIRRLRRTAR